MTRDELLNAAALQVEEVEIKGKKVQVTELCADDYLAVSDHETVKKGDNSWDGNAFNTLLVIRCVVDKNGNRIFKDEDAEAIRKGSFSTYRKLLEAAKRVNGLIGDAAKN